MSRKDISVFHPEYRRNVHVWRECRDFISGESALKAHDIELNGAINVLIPEASAYLPKKSPLQEIEKYYAYVDRAMYFNAPGRTLDGLVGLVFSHDPDIVAPVGTEVLQNDADLQGTPLKEFAEHVVREVLSTGRGGLLVEHTVAPPGLSKSEEAEHVIRPYINFYAAEDIVDWTITRVNNLIVPTRVVLRGEKLLNDDYEEEETFTELYMDNRAFMMVRWYKNKDEATNQNEPYIAVPIPTPRMNNEPLHAIPFWFVSTAGTDWKIGKPPLQDLIKVSRAHYRNSAQYENGLEYCGNPTPMLMGFQELVDVPGKPHAKTTLQLGSGVAVITAEPQANAKYLEFTGQGLQALEKALESKEGLMALLGSRMLYESKKAAEAAEALRIRYAGESATLADTANVISRVLTMAFKFECLWYCGSDKASIHLNTNYISAGADSNELSVIFQMYIKGSLPRQDFIRRLRAVGIINEDRTVELVASDMVREEAIVRERSVQMAADLSKAKSVETETDTDTKDDIEETTDTPPADAS